MDFLNGVELVNKNGKRVLANHALKEKKAIALYFSAHWCPPCRQFTPVLARAYSESRSSGEGGSVEVIFVSSDRSAADFQSYMREAHGDWLAVPFGDPLCQTLSSRFGVRGIPSLQVIGMDGTKISQDGRQDISALGRNAFGQWERLAPALVDTSTVNLLNDNTDIVKKEAIDILVKLLSNIIKDPDNIKYRQIKLSNPKIEEKLLGAVGGFEVLFSVGFEEDDDKVILPLSASIGKVEKFRDAIQNLLTNGSSSSSSSTSVASSAGASSSSGGASSSSAPIASSVPSLPAASSSVGGAASTTLLMPDVLAKEHEFLKRLESGKNHMAAYENPKAQAAALAVMPVGKLESAAREKFENAKKSNPEIQDSLYRDLLLLEFKEWFKTDFFSWVDAPKCDRCGGETTNKGMLVANSQEQAWGAGRVEGYTCKTCGSEVRFPRFHGKPEKLLETRKGRCGEWANCFVLCCRALGFDTRHVHDWTDHVWAEVWSEAESRWLHVDPGETVDKPLVYEVGWGKKLTYVIAHSKDEVQDVTWRYSKDHSTTRSRRTLVRPKWLVKMVLDLTAKCQLGYGPQEKERLTNRRLAECLELLTPRTAGEGDKQGRQTGSLAWRLARGELGANPLQDDKQILKPSDKEVEECVITVEYNAATDEYRRGDGQVIKGWRGGVFEANNVTRKVEGDWNMVYLAREEGVEGAGLISWKVDMEGSGMVAGRVTLQVGSKVYNTGRVVWQLCGGQACLLPKSGVKLETDQLVGSKSITLTANLGGGEGDCAWQHAQLFRCSRDGPGEDEPQLKLEISLKKA